MKGGRGGLDSAAAAGVDMMNMVVGIGGVDGE